MVHIPHKILFLFIILYSSIFCQTNTTIAVYNLRAVGMNKDDAEILTDHIRSVLVDKKIYRVIDRGLMDQILKEQEFQLSDCTSDECVVEIGKLLSVKKILTGSVGKFGKLYTIELRIIDVESGRIENSSLYNYEGVMEKLLTEGVYKSIDKLLSIKENQVNLTESVDKVGQITIISNPSKAEVIIDNEYFGNTPITIPKLSVGFHDIILKKDTYEDYVIKKEVPEGKININCKLVPKISYITIKSIPENSTVFLDDENIGDTPIINKEILVGNHKVSILKNGYKSETKNIFSVYKDTLEEFFSLKEIFGSLSLNVNPKESIIKIGDKNYNSFEVENISLLIGNYNIKVSNPYYYPETKSIEIHEGGKQSIDFVLKYGGNDLKYLEKKKKVFYIGALSSSSFTVVSAIIANYMYDKYKRSNSVNSIENYKRSTIFFDKFCISSLPISACIISCTIYFHFKEINLKKLLEIK